MAKQTTMIKQTNIVSSLDNAVSTVVGQHHLQGFEKAFKIAEATAQLKKLLTQEYMNPIMELQGSNLGFKTDKSYPLPVVRDCLIEAVLTGLQPVGNHFNIIAGQMYPTKEGLGYKLSNYPGLSYRLSTELPRINKDSTSAAVVVNLTWSINNGPKQQQTLDIPMKMTRHSGSDAAIGKATRKGRAWLWSHLTGSEISEGDASDPDSSTLATREPLSVDQVQENKDKLKSSGQTTMKIEDLP